MSVAIYPGSFDPLTNGHFDIVKRCAGHFEKLYLVVANSSKKSYLFSHDERVALAKDVLSSVDGVEVVGWQGLTIDCARKYKATAILRGVRAISDFDYEFSIAHTHTQLAPEIETFLVLASPQHSFVASNLVKEVARNGGDVSSFVPKPILTALNQKFS